MRKTMLLIAVVMALLLTSCTKGNRQTTEAAVSLVEAEESRDPEQEMENEAANLLMLASCIRPTLSRCMKQLSATMVKLI